MFYYEDGEYEEEEDFEFPEFYKYTLFENIEVD
jgi:hypothetical protein